MFRDISDIIEYNFLDISVEEWICHIFLIFLGTQQRSHDYVLLIIKQVKVQSFCNVPCTPSQQKLIYKASLWRSAFSI